MSENAGGSEPTAARAPASRIGLSRERILDAALALLDRQGLDAFTMRGLADELGVGTMTVYSYFRSKDELLDAVVDAAARQVDLDEGDGPWKARLRRLMLGMRQGLIEHPAAVELRLKRPLLSPGALQLTETGLRILREAGFSKRDAARAYRILFIYTFGYSAFGPGERSEADRKQNLQAMSSLPVDRYPTLADLMDEASDAMADRTLFEFGLDRLIEGFEASLERPIEEVSPVRRRRSPGRRER